MHSDVSHRFAVANLPAAYIVISSVLPPTPAGIIREEFTIRPDGRLEVKGRLSVEGRDLIVTQVYERYP